MGDRALKAGLLELTDDRATLQGALLTLAMMLQSQRPSSAPANTNLPTLTQKVGTYSSAIHRAFTP